MKSILITGGSGKVGFQLVKHFLENNFIVVTTTRSQVNFKEKLIPKLDKENILTLQNDVLELKYIINKLTSSETFKDFKKNL